MTMRSSSFLNLIKQDLDEIINFLSGSKLLEVALALPEAGKAATLRELSARTGIPKETLRGRLLRLAERKREVFQLLAQLLSPGGYVLLDPTWVNGEERIVVLAALYWGKRVALPLLWELRGLEGKKKSLVLPLVIRLKRLTGGLPFYLVADREFDSLELRKGLSKQGIGYVIRAKKRFRRLERERVRVFRGLRQREAWVLLVRKTSCPVRTYRLRPLIELLFKHTKSFLGLESLLNWKVSPKLREGFLILIMLLYTLLVLLGLYALELGRSPLNPSEYSPFRIGYTLTLRAARGCGLFEAMRRLEGGEKWAG